MHSSVKLSQRSVARFFRMDFFFAFIGVQIHRNFFPLRPFEHSVLGKQSNHF